ncbi:MAG: ParA family protein [Chlamydiales bacterium]|nr:ParA family protein [Chlamydiales bacterium]
MAIITVSSFKGGTAKTSTTLHLGAALTKFHKKKVLLIDFDAQANLTTGLGFDPDSHDSLAPVLQDYKSINDVILKTSIKNLDLIPADTWLERVEVTDRLASDRYSHEKLKSILQKLDYDVIIIDTPPSLSWLTESALIAATKCLICATPEFYSIKGLQRLSLFINQIAIRHPFDILGVSLSFWNIRGKSNDAFLEVIESTFPGKVLNAKIRRDIKVSEASVHGKPVFEISPDSRAAEDYKLLVKELIKKL